MSEEQAWRWLGKQLDVHFITNEPSLMNELKLANYNNKTNEKINIYLCGEPEEIYKMMDIFESVPNNNTPTLINHQKSNHPAVQWMNIYFYPPNLIKKIPVDKKITLVIKERIPIWGRKLLANDRINHIVTEKRIAPLKIGKIEPEFTKLEDFSYEQFFWNNDLNIVQSKNHEQLFADIPHQLILKMKIATKEERLRIMDEIALAMLDEYWLLNKPNLHNWMKILIREISLYYEIRMKDTDTNHILKLLEEWGYRDKSINSIRNSI